MLSDYDFGLIWSIYVHYMWWDELSNGFCEILRNIDEIPYGSHWLQWFLELRLLQKTAMLVTSGERDVKASIGGVQFTIVAYIRPLTVYEDWKGEYITTNFRFTHWMCEQIKYPERLQHKRHRRGRSLSLWKCHLRNSLLVTGVFICRVDFSWRYLFVLCDIF